MSKILVDKCVLKQALEALEADNSKLWPSDKRTAAYFNLRAALAEPVQEPIKWTLNGDKECGYNNWLGETSFGRILITWKGWKAYPDACVDEFPGGFHAYGEPEEVKAACDAEFTRRHGNAPPQHKPLTDEEIVEAVREADLDWQAGWTLDEHEPNRFTTLTRAIERAHGIGGGND